VPSHGFVASGAEIVRGRSILSDQGPYKPSRLSLNLDDRFVEILAERYETERYEIDPEDPPSIITPAPSAQEIRKLIETSFWASLTKEEGRPHRFRLGFWSEEEAGECLIVFTPSLPFSVEELAKIAPAFRADDYIGVWRDSPDDEQLYIWGTTYPSPYSYGFWSGISLEAVREGEIVISLPFCGSVAVVTVGGARVVDPKKAEFIRCPGPPGPERCNTSMRQDPTGSYLREIGKAMREHGRGGTLLVVPRGQSGWKESVEFQRDCRASKVVASALRNWDDALEKEEAARKQEQIENANLSLDEQSWTVSFGEPPEADTARAALRLVGQLTAVDGATVVTDQMVIRGFGAKIVIKPNAVGPDTVLMSEPFQGSEESQLLISRLGGMRHQSAARFVSNNRDCVALVASQDGAVSFFAWDTAREMLVGIRHAEFVL